MRFKDYLTEILAKEQGRGYFVLPTDINKRTQKSTEIESRKLRDNYSEEILDCLRLFLKKCIKYNKNFIVQTNRIKNQNTLYKLNIDINSKSVNQEVARLLLENLKPEYFYDDNTDDYGCHVYIFLIRDCKDKLGIDGNLYIKFSFIYDYAIFDPNEHYRYMGWNRYDDIVICPREVIVNTISIHSSRKTTDIKDKNG